LEERLPRSSTTSPLSLHANLLQLRYNKPTALPDNKEEKMQRMELQSRNPVINLKDSIKNSIENGRNDKKTLEDKLS